MERANITCTFCIIYDFFVTEYQFSIEINNSILGFYVNKFLNNACVIKISAINVIYIYNPFF